MAAYGLDDKPGLGPGLLYGLQWWAVSLPCVVIMGVVAGRLHADGAGEQVWYLQKLFALTGLATLAQIVFGHRLPLVIGPAAIVLVALTASSAAGGAEALYPALAVGGAAIALTGACGQLARLRRFFTPRVVTVILILIAFTLSPTILRLMIDGAAESRAGQLCFAVAMVFLMLAANQRLRGVWKSLTVLLGLALGSAAYFLIFGLPEAQAYAPPAERSLFVAHPVFEAGAVLSFLFCFPALIVNELGSIEALGYMLKADDLSGRSKRGVVTLGLSNVAAGALGVMGTVSFSLSAGLIAATGCAARRTLIPAGLALLLCAFFPEAVLVFSKLPGAVMGALMLYLMAAQLASGLSLMVGEKSLQSFNDALAVALPLMLGLIVSIAPPEAFAGFPALLRPIVGNGFIVGSVAAILLERLLVTSKK